MTKNTSSSIIRCPHDRQNPYAQISRDLIRDETLSPECRWLLIYLLSMADGWEIKVQQLRNHLSPHAGKEKIYSMINKCIEAGYMAKEYVYEKGLRRCVYILSETPKFKKCLPRPENPYPANQHPEKPDGKEEPKNKKKQVEEEESKPKKEESPLKSPTPDLKFGTYVHLKPDVYEKFITDLGHEPLHSLIDQINDYIDSTGRKPYKDYGATIRTWIRRNQGKMPSVNAELTKIKENKARVLEAIVQLRNSNDPKGKNIFLTEKEVVRLDTGKRIVLNDDPEAFLQRFLSLFNLEYKT